MGQKSMTVKSMGVRSSHHGSLETNLTNICEDAGSIPGFAQWVKYQALLWAVVEVEDAARATWMLGQTPWVEILIWLNLGKLWSQSELLFWYLKVRVIIVSNS